jgi:hypothetical protein
MAQIACLIYNANRGRNSSALRLSDFMWPKPAERMSAAEQRRVLNELFL